MVMSNISDDHTPENSIGAVSDDSHNLEVVFRNCIIGGCPTAYEDSNGDFILQGYELSPDQLEELKMPNGEDAIKLPRDFVQGLVDQLKESL